MKGTTLVRGKPVTGITKRVPDSEESGYIFVTEKLSLDKITLIKNAGAVICLDAGDTSHICVICRILGIPIIRLDEDRVLPSDHELVTVEPHTGIIWEGQKLIDDEESSSVVNKMSFASLTFQAGIFEPNDIAKVNLRSCLDVEQFFLRSEFLWLNENENPLEFVNQHGIDVSSEWLYQRIKRYFRHIGSTQILNFRSLDVRSDEFAVFHGQRSSVERNPQIGLHGIRQLLLEKELLEAEIKAVSKLYANGYTNLIFSIPFLTEECELREVKDTIQSITVQPIKLGVFIETPSAVSEFEYMIPYGLYCAYIGTKDLTQLVLACDRDNALVRHIYDSKKRPVLNAIRKVLKTGASNQVPVFLFCAISDLEFFLNYCEGISHVSMCASEFFEVGR